MKKIAVIVGVLAAFSLAVPAVAQEGDTIPPITLEGVVRGNAGDVIELASVPVPASLVGAECLGVLQLDNNQSVHPDNDLIIESGDDVEVIEDVESVPGASYTLEGPLGPLGDTIVVSMRLGPQGVSSGGMTLTLDCQPPTNPAIDIEKATNGEDADTPTGPEIIVGDPVDWTYVVTNTGDVALVDVTVVDDQGVTVTCPQDTLAVGETMTCTASGIAEVGQYANIGTVTGVAPDESTVSDTDPSHYIGVEMVEPNPAIDIEKSTNGQDADTQAEAVDLVVGDAITWEYVVTNTGDVDLSDVTVTDDQGVTVTCPQDTLAVGESMTCTAAGVAELGPYTNIGTVTGVAPDGSVVTDSDPSNYNAPAQQGGNPAIEIVKDPDLQVLVLTENDTATWTITVTNTGDEDLTDVTVTDAQAPGCDRLLGDLAIGESTSYTCTRSGIEAGFTNVAVVTGEDPNGIVVTDQDDAVVEIQLPATGAESRDLVLFGIALLAAGAVLIAPTLRRRRDPLDG